MVLEVKKRLDSLISAINTKLMRITIANLTDAIQAMWDEERAIIDKSITKIRDHSVLTIGSYAFYQCKTLANVDFPCATNIGSHAFYQCFKLKSADFPCVTSIGSFAFSACSRLTSIDFPCVTSIESYAFDLCKFGSADFPCVTSIGSYAFYTNINLKKLILRSNSIVSLSATSAFTNTPIASGEGYIYVPVSLVESYKSATNWVKFANQFRALEDYTVDGTVTGALDESKI